MVDVERALGRVNELARLCETNMERWSESNRTFVTHPDYGRVQDQITELVPLVEAIAGEVDPRLAEQLRKSDKMIPNTEKYRACVELRGVLNTRQEAQEILGPKGPQLAAAAFHRWVWNAARDLWSDGHRRAAIQAAATALLDSYVPAKLEKQRDSKGGKDLMSQAFSLGTPTPTAPRLRLPGYDKTANERDWNSAHEGAMELGQGAAQYVRNLTTHDLSEPDEQRALEMLAVLSLVARLVDDSSVQTAGD